MGGKNQLMEFEKIKKMGEGAYGSVYKALHKPTGQIVALKRIKFDDPNQADISNSTIREICHLKRLNHPNIVQLFHTFYFNNNIFLVLEFVDFDLQMVLDKANGVRLHPQLTKNFLWQIIHAVSFCEVRGIWHRDLKPQNLLVSRYGRLKLADFGLSKNCYLSSRILTDKVVSLWYRAPELLLGEKQYTSAIDIWSVGCIFYEMVTLTPMFPGDSEISQLYQIFQKLGTPDKEVWPKLVTLKNFCASFPTWRPENTLNAVKAQMPENGFQLLMKFLAYDPSKRIKAEMALSNLYFRDMEVLKLDNLFPAALKEIA